MSVSPDTVAEVVKDLGQGLKFIKNKQDDYQTREDYYQGTKAEVIAHPKLKTLLDKYGDSFQLNYASVPADALLDRIDLMSLTTGDETVDQQLRDRLWEPNSLDDDADDIHLHAAYLGDYYLVAEYITTDGQDIDGSDESSTGIGTVELTPKHPKCMAVIYQRTNSRIPDFAIQMVKGDQDGDWSVFVYYDDLTWEFEAEDAGDGFKADSYTLATDLDDEGVPDPVVNEFGFPVFHFRPDQKPYGIPVNRKMYGPQDAITKINATQMANMDYYGFPQRYALLDPDAGADDDIDADFDDSDGTVWSDALEGSNPTYQGRSKLTGDPGGMWMLNGVKGVGSFNPSDPKGFLDPLTFQIRAGAALTRTPLYEFDLDGSGQQPSGEARRRADGPITKHASKLKGQFGAVWTAIGQYCLRAFDLEQPGRKVVAVWAPSETATDKDGIDLVALKQDVGIPVRQALIEAGYTQDQVDDFLPVDELNGLKTPLSIDATVKLAAALKDLGTAKQLSSVNDDMIQRALLQFFGAIIQQETIPDVQEERVTDTIGNGPRPFGG